jgi:putative ABC transport system substrate-binding protein
MKRLAILVLVFSVAVFAVSAEGQQEGMESNVIGIAKIVSHPALDGVEQGIMDELSEQGYDYEFDLQNANGDMTTASQIATKFKSDDVRMAVGIATPTSQALVNALDEIPVVYSAVTDPVAAGLVDSFDEGGDNVTGVSDMTPVEAQFDIIESVGGVEALGHVYTSGETNAVTLAEMAEEAAEERGIDFVTSTVTNSAEVRQATQSIVNRVDVIYVSTDNTVVSALPSLVEAATNAGVPVVTADPSSAAESGVLAALGFEYYRMGRRTGQLIIDVLEGTETSEIPTVFMTEPSDTELLINLDVAEDLGIDLPGSVIDRANTLVEDGEVR